MKSFLCDNCGQASQTLTAPVLVDLIPHLNFNPNRTPSHRRALLSDVKSLLQSNASAMTEIDDEIARLTSTIQTLHARRAAIQAHSARHTNVLAPIHQLPPEILAEIFSFSLPPPMTIARVSRTWRAIAFALPQLWTDVTVGAKDFSQPRLSGGVVSSWLEHSRTMPLNIQFVSHDKGAQQSELVPEQRALMNTMAAHSRRWRTASLESRSEPFAVLLPQIKGQLDSLESLTIGCQDTADTFTVAPKLTELTLTDSHHLSPTSFPWTQLRSLTITGSADDVVNTLSLCISLEKLVFTLTETGMGAVAPLVHPTLSHLEVTDAGTFMGTAVLLSYMTLPVLDTLILRDVRKSGSFQPAFSAFVARSNCPLRRLAMENVDVKDTWLVESLRLLPWMEALEISNQGKQTGGESLTEASLLALLPPVSDDGTILCPALQRLVISGNFNLPSDTLAALLVARWNPTAEKPLSAAVALAGGVQSDNADQVFEQLRCAGMAINVSIGPKSMEYGPVGGQEDVSMTEKFGALST